MRIVLFLFLLAGLLSTRGHAQTSQVQYGKNRVQYHKDFEDWEKYESDNFVTYWYGDNQGLGQAVVQFAEYDFAYIQKILESRLNSKVQLITYRDITDVKQSNIGSDEVFTLPGGQTLDQRTGYISTTQSKILGNKAFVYFNGDHTDLRRQVREAIAGVYIENLLYGSTIQEVVQNAVLLNLPTWFKPGLIAYLGEDWNTELDDQLRELMATGEYEDFEELAADYPRLAGHSFWYYIAENLGKPTVSNLLYLTRINRSVENGFLYVLGSNYETVLFNWMEFYRNRYAADVQGRNLPPAREIEIKNKKNLPITALKVSPDGQRVAYVLNELGKYRVYLHNLQTGEREVVFKSGQRNLLQSTDYNYPILDFSPTNQELAILYEYRDEPRLMQYDLNTGNDVTEPLGIRLDRVYSMAYVDPGTMIMSASASGFSDIYTYFPASRQSVKITNDHWDDLDAMPVNIRGRRGVVFTSNRTDTLLRTMKLDTLLPIGDFDVFYYDLENKPGELVRISDTPLADERDPVPIDGEHISYLSDANGIYNRFQAHLEDYIHHYEKTIYLNDGEEITLHADSTLELLDTTLIDSVVVFPVIKERAVTEAVSNYPTNILRQDAAGRLSLGIELLTLAEGSQVRIFDFDTTIDLSLTPTGYRRSSYLQAGQVVPQFTSTGKDSTGNLVRPNKINPTAGGYDDGFLFQTRFEEIANAPAEMVDSTRLIDLNLGVLDAPPAPADADSSAARPPVTVVIPPGKRGDAARKANSAALPIRAERPVPELNRIYQFRPGRITPYRLTFRVNYVKTTADNSPLFTGMNTFAANPDGYTQQPVGILLKANILDLLEDHMIEGGVRIPTSFNGTEYYLTYEDRRRRLDKIYTAYRRNRRYQEGDFGGFRGAFPRTIEENTLMAQFGVRYPLDVFRSVRATATLRRDRVQDLPTELASLQSAPDTEARIGARLEYVFDNTIRLGTNLRMGSRWKVYSDFFKSFDISLNDGFDSNFEPGFIGILGVDARHYQRVLKRSVIALRAAGATNFGGQKVLYYLGGADNSLLNNFNNQIPTPTTGNFAFQDLANPLRGFDINIRNGGSYALGNAELRVPVFNYIFNNLRSALLRDFQIVGFFDVGTAWSGSSPFDEDNPVNITTYPDPGSDGYSPVVVRVRRFREPIVYGYGVGARTSLFGYFIRVDYAFGVETGLRQDGKFHFSMGYDF